ncbi:MAG: DHA2 family efflux MFS transporter permease subunit [Chloroflexi bacterium]|nr:DHA2 family efflux MFS transporter permease subunit [Chloroflexota bacterium]
MQATDTRAGPRLIAPPIQANSWIVLLVLTLGYFMILVDTTIVNVALPVMEKDLHAGFDQVLWVVNGYILAYAVLLITAGRLGDIFGPRRLFILGLTLFTLASAACGLSQDAHQLILFRAVQGIGAAVLTPQTLAILPTLFPPERRGSAFGILSSVAGLAVVVGPTVGGWLVTDFSWQAIFYLNVPIGVVAVLAAMILVPEIHSDRSPSLDLPGVALASSGLFALIYALVESQRFAWGPISSFGAVSLGSTRWGVLSVYSLLVYAVVLLLLFVWWETRAAQPLLPLSLFTDRNFSAANLIFSVVGFPFAMFIVLSIFLQSILGFSAVHAGLSLIPTSIGIMVVGPIAGRLSDRVNGKYLLLGGLVAAAVGVVLTAYTLSLSVTSWQLVLPLAVTGVGMGFVFAPLTTLAMRDVQPTLAGAASGFLFTNRQVGQALGSAVIGSVLANRVAGELPGQATRVAAQAPASDRSRFVADFQLASHGSQDFGAGQTHAVVPPPGASHAVSERLAALSHDVFAQAFLNAARPSLAICAGILVLAALFAGGLRGGHGAGTTHRAEMPAQPDAA